METKTELNAEQRKELHEKIRDLEQELLAKNRSWPQEKANWAAKKILCLL